MVVGSGDATFVHHGTSWQGGVKSGSGPSQHARDWGRVSAMSCRPRRPRRHPLTALLGSVALAVLLAPVSPVQAENDPLDNLAGPPSSRFT